MKKSRKVLEKVEFELSYSPVLGFSTKILLLKRGFPLAKFFLGPKNCIIGGVPVLGFYLPHTKRYVPIFIPNDLMRLTLSINSHINEVINVPCGPPMMDYPETSGNLPETSAVGFQQVFRF